MTQATGAMAILAQLNDNVVTHRFALDKATILLGRLAECDICVDSQEVSGRHAQIERSEADGAYYIEDLGSTNHTFVNEKPVERVRLHDADVVRIGWTVFKFMDESNPDHRKTKKIHKSWIPGVYYTR